MVMGKSARMLFLLFLFSPFIFSPSLARTAQSKGSWVRSQNKVIAKDVRFTVISPSLVRLEYSPTSQFVDEKSILVQNRDWGTPPFSVQEEKGWLILKTNMLTLRYKLGSGAFNKDNLEITWVLEGRKRTWRPGDIDGENLGGTVAALDGVSRDNLPPFPPGILSRAGYFFLDDTPHPLWDEWWEPRPPSSQQDWYFFCYGHDYALALDEYTRLTGRIPMLPRYAFGAWYSRYWPYSDEELREIIRTFRRKGIPLDVLVIDVDWHLYGWEAYDWNPQYFPKPEEFIRWCHDQGIKITLNTHPGTPIPSADSHFEEFCRRLGVDPKGRDSLGYNLANKRDALAFGDVFLASVLKQGVDFLWIDGAGASAPGIDHFAWTNKVYYETIQRVKGGRGLIFGRQGLVGSGTHRYPVGFSGDTYSQWEVLRYEIPFTVKGGQVGILWSHDIGGFMGDKLPDELYVRWVQFGVFSPIFRLHSNHGRRLPWDYSEEAESIVREYLRLRYRLFPYIYSISRLTHERGLPICRGVYFEYPNLEEAYHYDYEYFFGPNLLVAPIDQPGKNGVALKEVYLPPGLWYDYFKGKIYRGGRTLLYRAKLDEVPVFARAGAIIPLQPDMQFIGEKAMDPLTVDIYAGANGDFTLYEDDRLSLDYEKGAFARTPIVYREGKESFKVVIGPTEGTYKGQLRRRSYILRVHGVASPKAVRLNGRALGKETWSYDGENMEMVVRLPSSSIRAKLEVEVETQGSSKEMRDLLSGISLLREFVSPLEGYSGRLTSSLQEEVEKEKALIAQGEEALKKGDYRAAGRTKGEAEKKFGQILEKVWRLGDEALRNEILRDALGIHINPRLEEGKLSVDLAVTNQTFSPQEVAVRVMEVPEDFDLAQRGEVRFGKEGNGTKGMMKAAFPLRYTGKEKYPLGTVRVKGESRMKWGEGKILTLPIIWEMDYSALQCWRLFGVFDNANNEGMNKVYPPEEWMGRGVPSGLEGEKRTAWSFPSFLEGGMRTPVYIDFLRYFGEAMRNRQVVAYALTYIYSPQDQEAVLSIGSDDGCVIWVNGEKVYAYLAPRVARADEDKANILLRKGWNEVLVKLGQVGGDWGFYIRILGKEGRGLYGLYQAWEIP